MAELFACKCVLILSEFRYIFNMCLRITEDTFISIEGRCSGMLDLSYGGKGMSLLYEISDSQSESCYRHEIPWTGEEFVQYEQIQDLFRRILRCMHVVCGMRAGVNTAGAITTGIYATGINTAGVGTARGGRSFGRRRHYLIFSPEPPCRQSYLCRGIFWRHMGQHYDRGRIILSV